MTTLPFHRSSTANSNGPVSSTTTNDTQDAVIGIARERFVERHREIMPGRFIMTSDTAHPPWIKAPEFSGGGAGGPGGPVLNEMHGGSGIPLQSSHSIFQIEMQSGERLDALGYVIFRSSSAIPAQPKRLTLFLRQYDAVVTGYTTEQIFTVNVDGSGSLVPVIVPVNRKLPSLAYFYLTYTSEDGLAIFGRLYVKTSLHTLFAPGYPDTLPPAP